ncbi:hypothetical protein ACSBR1_039310 [Camellia fascicularis]
MLLEQALFALALANLNHVVLLPSLTLLDIDDNLVTVLANLGSRTRPERHERSTIGALTQEPLKVSGLLNEIIKVSSGYYHSSAITVLTAHTPAAYPAALPCSDSSRSMHSRQSYTQIPHWCKDAIHQLQHTQNKIKEKQYSSIRMNYTKISAILQPGLHVFILHSIHIEVNSSAGFEDGLGQSPRVKKPVIRVRSFDVLQSKGSKSDHVNGTLNDNFLRFPLFGKDSAVSLQPELDMCKVIVMDADGTHSKGIARSLRKLGLKAVFEADPNICNGFGTYVHLLLGFTLRLIFASTERGALKAKYQKVYGSLYDKRCEIVNGVVEVEGVTSEITMDLEDDKSTKAIRHERFVKMILGMRTLLFGLQIWVLMLYRRISDINPQTERFGI